jgi:hypothetical protein
MSQITDALATPQTAAAALDTPHAKGGVRVTVTPAGMLAIGALVAAILWSVPPIVRAAGRAHRDAAPGR